MNDHDEIRKHLSAFSSGDLDPTLAAGVERHLVLCAACRSELAELKTSLRLLRSTPEVEPPPWMTARIMARVKALQPEKRSWLQRIFFPLRIKLPLEALALLMVCVTGWYISRTVETELKQPAPQQSREIQAPSAPAPAATQEAKDLRERPAAARQQTVPQPGVPTLPPASVDQPAPRPGRNLPDAAPTYAPPPPSRKDEQSAPAAGGRAESMKAAPAAESFDRARDTELENKSRTATGALRNQAESLSPAAVGHTAGKQAQQSLPQMSIRLSLADPALAPDAVREALVRCGGYAIDESDSQRNRIKARIPAARIVELLQRLERLGRLAERPSPLPGAELLEVTVQW